MLKRITAVLSISLLLMLQYGKITSYLYCEWEAKVIQQLPDCNCSHVLSGVFDQADDHSATNVSISIVKFADYIPASLAVTFESPHWFIHNFDAQHEDAINDGFSSVIPRPPLA